MSSTAWLVCFRWRGRGFPARHRITAASRSSASRRAESESLRCSTAPAVQDNRDHITIAERPAGLGWPAAQTVACVAEPAHGDDILCHDRAPARTTTSPTASMGPRWCHSRQRRVYGPPPRSAGVEGGNRMIFALPGYREGIRPHRSREVVVGSDTARVGACSGWQFSAVAKRSMQCGSHRAPSAWNTSARRR